MCNLLIILTGDMESQFVFFDITFCISFIPHLSSHSKDFSIVGKDRRERDDIIILLGEMNQIWIFPSLCILFKPRLGYIDFVIWDLNNSFFYICLFT